ncbi:MAG: CBS domain-containing protein [Actinobacteria bacterium]|nr:MAG: CBS domain-containing protein [Actinomycetota bacterium]
MSILVRHAMTESPQTVRPDMNASDAAGLMKSEDVGALPVVKDGQLVGLVTDRDLVVRVLAERQDPESIRVGDIATRSPVTVTPDMRLAEARELMERHRIRRLPVMKREELVGILSLGDVAWADASTREVGEALKAVSESESTTTQNETADRGTPDRVRHKRRAS